MFTMAGWNQRARSTGVVAMTRSIHGGSGQRLAPAELYRHECGDLLWVGIRSPRFVVWGETCRFATYHEAGSYWTAHGARRPYSDIRTREEFGK